MLFSEVKTKVRANMPVEAARQGTQTVLDNLIIQCIIDLQDLISCYEQVGTQTYTFADVTIEGHASKGTLPSGAKLTKANIFYPEKQEDDVETVSNPDDSGLSPVTLLPWEYLQTYFISHAPAGFQSIMTVGPDGRTFYCRPILEDGKVELKIEYRYIKQTYIDTDDVTIDDQAIFAISNYVKAYLSIEVDEDQKTANVYDTVWQRELNKLYIRCKDKQSINAR